MEHFIETVRKYPCLWNSTALEYRDQEVKDAAWAEVTKETNLPSVKDVKLKWKKLRDSYRDALKRQSDMLAKDPANTGKKCYAWKYTRLMQFLQPHMSNRKKAAEKYQRAPAAAADNGQNGAEAQSSDDSDSEAEPSPKRRSSEQLAIMERKLDYLCKVQMQNKKFSPEDQYQERKCDGQLPILPDPLDIFFNSMCQSTKRLPYNTQIEIKKVLFNAVVGAEEALIAEQQSYANLWVQQEAGSSSSSNEGAGGEDGTATETEGPVGDIRDINMDIVDHKPISIPIPIERSVR